MFNSKNSLTSSITGWFSSGFSREEKPDDEPAKAVEEENKVEVGEGSVKQEEKPAETEENEEKDAEKSASEGPAGASGKEETAPKPEKSEEDVQAKLAKETQKMVSSALTFGNYLFGVASEASKKVSEKVTETATTIKKTVEEKSIIGDLNREQQEFLEKKRERQTGDASVPPWVGYQEAETMKQQILALSTDKRNFMRNPPAGVQFNFDFDHHFPVAMATLREDENLEKMRFDLVPKFLKEEIFWRNYFYRVSLIKQSAQLSTLADFTRSKAEASSSSASSTSSAVIIGSTNTGTLSRSSSSKSINKSDTETPLAKPKTHDKTDSLDNLDDTHEGVGPEFVSDAFDPSELNADDLEREMKQLGMEDGGGDPGDVPEWEQELQKELQDYEMVASDDGKDNAWEEEIENMLNDDGK